MEIKSIPASLRDDPHTKLSGRIQRAWGGDNFEFGQLDQLHYFFLIGVDCPERGQPFFQEAQDFLLQQTNGKSLEIEVLRYDELKREMGHAWVENPQGNRINLGIALLQRGYAWYDGNVFENSATYQTAQEKARAAKTGLWGEENPVPPWKFWGNSLSEVRGN